MNNFISAFSKICACTAIIVGAPLLAASTVEFTTSQINRDLEYRACLVTAKLDHASADRCIR
jgi:hypothetical protein